MRIVVIKRPLRQLLPWIRRSLLICAVSTLAYCGFVVADGWMFQNRERRQLNRLLHDRQPTSGARNSPAVLPIASTEGLIGRMEIPRLGVSVMVVEGVDQRTLRRAVGHIPGTAPPGQPGNVGISGHRDTFFRPLRNIRQDDIIMITTLAGEYRYRVVSMQIVGPGNVAVLDPSESEVLTLVTCYPFYFVGPAPDRFIVRAERIKL